MHSTGPGRFCPKLFFFILISLLLTGLNSCKTCNCPAYSLLPEEDGGTIAVYLADGGTGSGMTCPLAGIPAAALWKTTPYYIWNLN